MAEAPTKLAEKLAPEEKPNCRQAWSFGSTMWTRMSHVSSNAAKDSDERTFHFFTSQ